MWKLVNCGLGATGEGGRPFDVGVPSGNIAGMENGGSPEGVDDFYSLKMGDIPAIAMLVLPRRVNHRKIPTI